MGALAKRPVVLVHGYSDAGDSFAEWRERLLAAGHMTTDVYIGNYVTRSNEVTIKDIAEGFDRALASAGLRGGAPFDAVVHSTGMLVVREWLVGASASATTGGARAERLARLKHLVGLAPATFGSPMAHKGRSWLGAIFKGGKQPGPDFLEAGDRVLRSLELASDYTWDLAHRDLFGGEPVYGRTASTPFPFIFVGLDDFGWLKRLVTEPGTDGVIRWAGVSFNSRKVRMDLTVAPTRRERVSVEPWKNTHVPTVFLSGHNHNDVLHDPSDELVSLVLQALDVSTGTDYDEWTRQARIVSRRNLDARRVPRWQQFIVHAVDERGDDIPDYFVEIGAEVDGRFRRLESFDMDVHAFRDNTSYRSFHVNLDRLTEAKSGHLALRIIGHSGTDLVSYCGFVPARDPALSEAEREKWDGIVGFDSTIGARDVEFFFPFTTTLIEIRLNREPMPREGPNRVFWFGRPA
jgi:hypothetical protein